MTPVIDIIEGDITRLRIDAIINAANPALVGGGGVDGAIHAAAGPALLDACLALPEASPGVRCPTGHARLTPGFALPARWVIHTVGPVWRGGDADEASLLAVCHRNSLRLAVGAGARAVAFPAISCGVYGYPVGRAASVAVAAARAWLSETEDPPRVVFCCFNAKTAAAFRAAHRAG